ncbi:ThiF family adenylyltransferase [Anaeroselena agilis]|uniref:ThiF family adenylyltransferase n=1 Tax=Anaeroselena agilis TaxID=3063788 RepID=A0ABU3P1B8_9FIRM|nr:ThiF family adenylyltransferase [Selenomonadales bacterium 4137-cl]
MDYWQVYQRNIGLFTREQQQKLRDAKVFVAGAGGVGGIEAATLARFGIGELVIMDPGVFDEPDMNRQFAAMASTLGENKARATARLLRDINPFLKVEALESAPSDDAELAAHMAGSAVVIDAIDYAGFDYKARFARIARAMGVLNFTAPIPGFGTLMAVFDPGGMTLEEFYGAPADPALWPAFRIPMDRIQGETRYAHLVRSFLGGERNYLTTCAGAAALNGGLVATEIALVIAGLRRSEELAVAPRVTYVDILSRVFEVYTAAVADGRGHPAAGL